MNKTALIYASCLALLVSPAIAAEEKAEALVADVLEAVETPILEQAQEARTLETLAEKPVRILGDAALTEQAPAETRAEQKTEPHVGHHVKWSYVEAGAPQQWGSLHPDFELCGNGTEQSPINITQYLQSDLPPLKLEYKPTPLNVMNNGHALQVNYEEHSGMSVGDQKYTLKQIHFHTPSEHYLDGSPYPMEAHLVHQNKDGALAVVGVMMKVGAPNSTIEAIWQNAPIGEGEKTIEGIGISAADILPALPPAPETKEGVEESAEESAEEEKPAPAAPTHAYYSYDGSLATPPCTEGVSWFVLKDPITISENQLRIFKSIFPVNARPLQPLGQRVVKGN